FNYATLEVSYEIYIDNCGVVIWQLILVLRDSLGIHNVLLSRPTCCKKLRIESFTMGIIPGLRINLHFLISFFAFSIFRKNFFFINPGSIPTRSSYIIRRAALSSEI